MNLDTYKPKQSSDVTVDINPYNQLPFKYNDGGREKAGYRGKTGDCVVRAIAIASGREYKAVYDECTALNLSNRITKRNRKNTTARKGVQTKTKAFKKYMEEMGFTFVPTMRIGSGCKVHLRQGDLPEGDFIAVVSRHWVSVINGVINDTHDCSREGTRCVYGYWIKKDSALNQ